MNNDSHTGSALSCEDLLRAYSLGYFPMSESRDDPEIFWVLPERRGALPLEEFHLPRSIRKALRQDIFSIRIDTAFRETMHQCAAHAPNREETWINDRILNTYCQLHKQGFAHSVECWQNDQLVGGLYGVSLRGVFFGESMFSRVTNASKVAMAHLVGRLKVGGYSLLDTQFYTEHLGQFGVREMPKSDYQILLNSALLQTGQFYALPNQSDGSTILQSITQTS